MEEKKPLGRGARLAMQAKAAMDEEMARRAAAPPPQAQTTEIKMLGRGQRLLAGIAAASSGSSGSGSSLPAAIKSNGAMSQDSGNGSAGRGRGVALGRGRIVDAMKSSGISSTPSADEARVAPCPVSVGAAETAGMDKSSKDSSSLEGYVESLKLESITRKGTIGTRIPICTNLIRLEFDKEKGVHHYHVSFNPLVDHMAYRFAMVRQHFPRIPGLRCFDGNHSLYLPYIIEGKNKTLKCEHPHDATLVEITIKYTGKLPMKDCVQMMNILMNNVTKELRLARLGRQHFNYQLAMRVPQYKLEIWPGFITAIQEKEDGIFLTCDVIHRVLRSETALEVLMTLSSSPAQFQDEAIKALLGVTVLTRYNNAMYRVDDIVFDMTPMSEFPLKNGSSTTFVAYYKTQYDLDIKDINQPLLMSKPRKKSREDSTRDDQQVLLIPELCFLTGISDPMRADFKVMKEIANCTKVTPQQRNFGLTKFIKQIKDNENARGMLREWGLRLPDEPTFTEGRVMPGPKILLGGGKHASVNNADWARDLRSNRALRTFDLNNWILVYSSRDDRRAKSFASLMQRCGPGLGINISSPRFVPVHRTTVLDYTTAIKSNHDDRTEAVVVIAHQARDDLYSSIKKVCLKERAVTSQVVNSNTLAREDKMRPIVQNIALQINAKMGGALWGVDIPLKNLMVCGIDSYHDPSHRGPSVGAFVASTDSQFTSYYSQAVLQKSGQEIISALAACFPKAVTKYYQANGSLPRTIIIYRDGVNDYELNTVREFEVKQMAKTLSSVETDYTPKIIYVVVQKRISTRIYMSSARGLDNCPPGSLLDQTITKRGFDNFLLVSQHVRQGTASPNHYVVVHDDAQMSIDNIQRLTYAMCHLYYNWPGTVRVPAPCQYAHKLAYLVGQHVKATPDSSLNDKLYYL